MLSVDQQTTEYQTRISWIQPKREQNFLLKRIKYPKRCHDVNIFNVSCQESISQELRRLANNDFWSRNQFWFLNFIVKLTECFFNNAKKNLRNIRANEEPGNHCPCEWATELDDHEETTFEKTTMFTCKDHWRLTTGVEFRIFEFQINYCVRPCPFPVPP